MKLNLFWIILLMSQFVFGQKFDTINSGNSTNGANTQVLQRDFMKTYNLEGRKTIMARVMGDFELRNEPSCTSSKTGMVIPNDSIIYIYKYFPEEKCWATQFHGQWGFITDSKVFPISKRTVKVHTYDIPPKLKTKISPKYPKEAKKKGIKGKVYIKVYIDENGKATKTIVLKGIQELNQAAIDAVKKAKYKAAKLKGENIGVWVTLFLDFK